MSRYDDYLADDLKKPDYKAGDTLKLILPFLKAAGLTNGQIRDYSFKTMQLMPGAEGAYRFLHGVNFPCLRSAPATGSLPRPWGSSWALTAAHIFCTELDLDRYSLTPAEAEELRRLQAEILAAPEIELPPGAASLADLPGPVQEAIGRFDGIFFEQIPAMDIGVIYREVNPVGGAGEGPGPVGQPGQDRLQPGRSHLCGGQHHRRPGL